MARKYTPGEEYVQSKGKWRNKGRFASTANVEESQLRSAGLYRDRGGRYQHTTGGFATKKEVEEAKEGARNERVNIMMEQKIAAMDKEDKAGFWVWAKKAYTGRNRPKQGQDIFEKIIERTHTKNLAETWEAYVNSASGKLYNAIRNVDEDTLKKEFSSLTKDIDSFIERLRDMTKEERYEVARDMSRAWEASHASY